MEPEVERGPEVGGGKFVKDLEGLCGDVQKELAEKYYLLRHDLKSWARFVKKMLLIWHPDKNLGFKDKSTEVTKFIQNERERLESIID